MTSPCPRYEPELSAYLDGETAPALRAEIETHLAACAACRAAVSRLRGVSRVLRRWDAHETRYAASSGFRNRVFAEVGARGGRPRTNLAWRVAAAVGFVAVGATGFALVAPRLAAHDEDPSFAALARQVDRLKQIVESSRAAKPAVGATDSGGDARRLEKFVPVVEQPSADDDPPVPTAAIPDDYEQRGERRFLREALPDHDDYNRERGTLVLQEQMAKALEAAKSPPRETATAAPPAPPALATFLGEMRVSQREFAPYHQVQVWPIELVGGRAQETGRLVPCEKAIHDKVLLVTEGPVRETVVAENTDGKRAVLVLAGDVLYGGVQDRVARSDVLVGPGEQISIPTYTSGRERRGSRYSRFNHSAGLAPPSLRALIAADRALLSGGLSQARFDAAVADTVKALASTNRLGSLDNLYMNDELDKVAKKYVDQFEKRLDAPNVVGFAVSAGRQLLGVEVFGDHATFVDHRARVLRSYVLAALAASPDGTRLEGTPSRDDALRALKAVAVSGFHDESAIGSGALTVFRAPANAAFGFGLLEGSHALHAVLFTSVPDFPEPGGGRGLRADGGGGADPGASDEAGRSADRGGAPASGTDAR